MSNAARSKPPSDFELTETSCGILLWRNDCHFYFRASPGCNHCPSDIAPFLDAAKEHLEERTIGPKQAPILIDRRSSYSSTFEARSSFAGWASDSLSAIAWLAPNPMAYMAAESARLQYVNLENLSPSELRIFATEDSALRWIKRVSTYDVARSLAARFKDDPDAAPVIHDLPHTAHLHKASIVSQSDDS